MTTWCTACWTSPAPTPWKNSALPMSWTPPASATRRAACVLMEQAQEDWHLTATQAWIDRYAPLREDVRAALDWGSSPKVASNLLAIRLTVSAMPLWQELPLLREHGLARGRGAGTARHGDRAAPALEHATAVGAGQPVLSRRGWRGADHRGVCRRPAPGR